MAPVISLFESDWTASFKWYYPAIQETSNSFASDDRDPITTGTNTPLPNTKAACYCSGSESVDDEEENVQMFRLYAYVNTSDILILKPIFNCVSLQ